MNESLEQGEATRSFAPAFDCTATAGCVSFPHMRARLHLNMLYIIATFAQTYTHDRTNSII